MPPAATLAPPVLAQTPRREAYGTVGAQELRKDSAGARRGVVRARVDGGAAPHTGGAPEEATGTGGR